MRQHLHHDDGKAEGGRGGGREGGGRKGGREGGGREGGREGGKACIKYMIHIW